MKAQRVRIDGLDKKNLIVVFNPDGSWDFIATIDAIQNYKENFAYLDSNGILKQNGAIIGTEDDVVFIGEPFDIEFPTLQDIIAMR